jgi:CheY-like chemotaxis protein
MIDDVSYERGEEMLNKKIFSDCTTQEQPRLIYPHTKQYWTLVVDDNEAVLALMSEFLNMKGFNVMLARDGLQAISWINYQQPDLILMDLHLPVLDGLSAIKQIRQDKTLQLVPIIVMTGDRDADLRQAVDEAGYSYYMNKPIDLENLELVLQQCLYARRVMLQLLKHNFSESKIH